jgi:transcriptional regulator with XRE-family HTH domain
MGKPNFQALRSRMTALAMEYPALAGRSGVSVAALKRIVSGEQQNPSIGTLRAIAEALGVEIRIGHGVEVVEQSSAAQFKESAARRKAEMIVRLVQGTSALEAQAVGPEARRDMVTKTVHELMTSSPRRLWAS